jgi:hypothetical protein
MSHLYASLEHFKVFFLISAQYSDHEKRKCLQMIQKMKAHAVVKASTRNEQLPTKGTNNMRFMYQYTEESDGWNPHRVHSIFSEAQLCQVIGAAQSCRE